MSNRIQAFTKHGDNGYPPQGEGKFSSSRSNLRSRPGGTSTHTSGDSTESSNLYLDQVSTIIKRYPTYVVGAGLTIGLLIGYWAKRK